LEISIALKELDTENADRDIKTASITVLTHTPTINSMCMGYIKLGDGTKNLDGTGGDFKFVVTVGGQTVQPSPQIIAFGTEVRSAVWTTMFPVPANAEVILKVLSPNAADSDVDVTAYLYDCTYALPAAAYDAAGGLPISDAGGLDLDAKLANTNEITAARMGALTDWIDGGRLDLLLDACATATKLTKYVQLLARKDAAIATDNATELTAINANGGSGAGAYNNTTEALEALRDNLALSSDVTLVKNNPEDKMQTPSHYDIPAAGVLTYLIDLYIMDSAGNMKAPDAAPTIGAVEANSGLVSHALSLDSTTMSLVGAETGHYRSIYTVGNADLPMPMMFPCNYAVGGLTRRSIAMTNIGADETQIDAIYDALLVTHPKVIVPPATGASLATKLDWIYAVLNGAHTTDAITGLEIRNADGDVIGVATVTNPTPTSTRRGVVT
jgi:hypothetical protein